MRAVAIEKYGSPEVLQLKHLPDLEPSRGEVRVKVRASALNRVDVVGKIILNVTSPGVIS